MGQFQRHVEHWNIVRVSAKHLFFKYKFNIFPKYHFVLGCFRQDDTIPYAFTKSSFIWSAATESTESSWTVLTVTALATVNQENFINKIYQIEETFDILIGIASKGSWKRCAPLPSPLYSAAVCFYKGTLYVFSHQVWSWDFFVFPTPYNCHVCLSMKDICLWPGIGRMANFGKH